MSDDHRPLQSTTNGEQAERNSSWKQAYFAVRHEKDLKRLTNALMAAEAAIYERLQELSGSSDHSAERAEIQAANEELLKVKTRKLGWPHPVAGS